MDDRLVMVPDSGWRQLHVRRTADGVVHFRGVGANGTLEVAIPVSKATRADAIAAEIAAAATIDPRLAASLHDALIPPELHPILAEDVPLVLVLDRAAATYPWEILQRVPVPEGVPLAVRRDLVRELADVIPPPLERATRRGRALVIGDPPSGKKVLRGAREEAASVADLLATSGYRVTRFIGDKADAGAILAALGEGDWQILHIAGREALPDGVATQAGIVLSPELVLDAEQLEALPDTPQLAFLNVCHMAAVNRTRPDEAKAEPDLLTGLLQRGCPAVVAPRRSVEDLSAARFALSVYESLLGGAAFGRAIWRGRQAIFASDEECTWASYHAYGDARLCLPEVPIGN